MKDIRNNQDTLNNKKLRMEYQRAG